MAGDPLRDAFRTKLQAIIAAAAIAWPFRDTINTGDQPPAAGGYVDMEFHGGQEDEQSWGSPGDDRYKETGQVMVRLFPPRNTGHDTAEVYALALRNGFRGARFAMTGGGSVKITAVSPMGGGFVDAAWWCETIAIQYRVYNFG
jgi:hypothetical protein